MNDVNVEDVVLSSLADSCGCDPSSLSLDSSLIALGVDSISILTLASVVQDMFAVEIDSERMDQLLLADTIADIVTITRSLIAASTQAT